MPRFDQSFSGLCEQNLQDTLQLKQRYLDAKAKRAPKGKQDKKQQDASSAPVQGSVHVQQKFLKRPPSADAHECVSSVVGQEGGLEPPLKLQCTGGAPPQDARQEAALTKFSVEIVQQLEFTTSAASSQPQQISTNVTVKTHANASLKSDEKRSDKLGPDRLRSDKIGLDVVGNATLVECVKQEPDNDFADLDQCAAALEKDAANGGAACFGGFSDLIGDDTNDEIISSATFNDLISDISNYPDYELMKDFDFEEKAETKIEEQQQQQQQPQQQHQILQHHHQSPHFDQHHHHQHHHHHQQQSKPLRLPSNSSAASAQTANVSSPSSSAQVELSPAAQTLKQMAEQHHKNQLSGLASFQARTRSPYADFAPFQAGGEYGSAQQSAQQQQQQYASAQQKAAQAQGGGGGGGGGFQLQPDMIKQEMIFQGGGEFDMKRKQSVYKQQYSPYGSPGPGGGHGSPGYLPGRGGAAPPQPGGGGAGGQFGGGTPPRPPSGPGGGGGASQGGGASGAGAGGGAAGVATASVQINQAQQMSISQQNHGGHTIQVSAGQHVHLSGDLKGGNVSIAAQQGMHFTQGQPPGQQQHQQTAQGQQQQQPQPQQQQQQQPQAPQQQQHQNSPLQSSALNSPGPMGGNQSVAQMGSPLQMPSSMMGGGNMGGPGQMQQHPAMQQQQQQLDGYSMSQTQTINFTQQSLRRTGNNGPGMTTMGPNMSQLGNQSAQPGRLLNAQSIEQQKLLHQQHMLRAQQQAAAATAAAAMQQQQQQQQQQQMAAAAAAAAAATRPPPPDYKAAAMMQPRYAPSGGVRRMPHQPMPPSGPMIRSNMYMLQQQQHQQQQQQHLQQQQQQQRPPPVLYRQQSNQGMSNAQTAAMLDQQQQQQQQQQQHNPSEWRHLLMSQQQNTSFGGMRPPPFQQGFNMNSSGGMQQQMTALQHQQMRAAQQNLLPVQQQQQQPQQQQQQQPQMTQAQMLGQGSTNSGAQLQQMSHMNQAAMQLHMQQQQQHQQQQQNLMQQQHQHMSLSSIHMQQSQSISMSNSPLQQQQQQQPNNSSQLGCFNPQAEFNFEFLDNLTGGDGSTTFTDQELLNSFDTDAGFNLDF